MKNGGKKDWREEGRGKWGFSHFLFYSLITKCINKSLGKF